MEKIIVNFASKGRENYPKAQLRLIRSCEHAGWESSYLLYSLDGDCDEYLDIKINQGTYPKTSTNNHAEIPYGFKPDIILEAKQDGFKTIIWADSTICMSKYPEDTIVQAKRYGVAAFHNLGHPLKSYVSDNALKAQDLSETQLERIEQIMACVICFDFTHPTGEEIFNKWFEASRDGQSFQNYGSERHGFIAHRHDQAVLSMLLFKYGIPLLPYGKLVYQPHDTNGEFGNDFEWINKGVDIPL